MRIALLSDIHGNRLALEAVLADAGSLGVDAYLVLGDHVAVGPEPVAVIAPTSEPVTEEVLEELVEEDELEAWGDLEEVEPVAATVEVEAEPRKTVPDVDELRQEMQALAEARGAMAPQRNRARWTVPAMGVLIVAGIWYVFRLLAQGAN